MMEAGNEDRVGAGPPLGRKGTVPLACPKQTHGPGKGLPGCFQAQARGYR